MLQLFEKLINEHGSSVILKERLTSLKDEYAQIEKAKSELHAKCSSLQSELKNAQTHIEALESELASLKNGVFAKYVCDHCGNPNIKRIGNRPDPTFGDLGIKQLLFKCNACGLQSAFTETRA